MPYKLHPFLADEEFKRHNSPARHYMEGLEAKGLLIELDNILVDAEQLVLRTFQCNTGYCVRCDGEASAKRYKGSCCTDLQVDISPGEAERLMEMARLADERLDFAPAEPVRRVLDSILAGKAWGLNDDKELAFNHKKNGACAMSWMEGAGQLRCSINTLCHRLGLPLEDYKPAPCFIFPLHYSEIENGRYLLSILSEETRYWIQQHKDVTRLRCLSRPEPGAPPAYVSLRGELEHAFGKRFYKELDEHARPILQERLAQNGSLPEARRPA